MRRRFLPRWAVPASAGLCLLAQPAAAQLAGDGGLPASAPVGGALSSYGTGTRVGDLRPQLERYFQTSVLPNTAPTFVVQPSIGVDLGFTDNANRGSGSKRADAFTVITPTVAVIQDSARIKTNLIYSPSVQLYATTDQTQFNNFFNGQSLVTLARDALFLDLRGSITQSSILGSGFNDGTSTRTYGRDNQVQTINFAVTPYAQHRFGGWGTARIGYSFVRTLQDADNDAANGTALFDQFGNPVLAGSGLGNQGFGNRGYGSIGNLTTQRERASFTTGENLGRFNNQTILEAIQYGGSGYTGSFRNQALNELGFALTRRITLLGGIGYQDIRYTGNRTAGVSTGGVRISEPTWNVGTRYSPNPESSITVLYGRRDGSTSVTLDGQYSPTARTRVFARYSTGISSDLEDAQNLLETTSVGPAGLVTDSVTGAPVSGGGVFGVQNGIYRVKRGNINGLYLANRDSYSVTVGIEDRTTLTNSASYFTGTTIPAGTSTSSYYATGSWQHDLAPDMSTNLSVQYGTSNNTSQLLGTNTGRQDTVAVLASLSKQFTQTLSGSARYVHNERLGGNNNALSARSNSNNYSENIILVGLRKGF